MKYVIGLEVWSAVRYVIEVLIITPLAFVTLTYFSQEFRDYVVGNWLAVLANAFVVFFSVALGGLFAIQTQGRERRQREKAERDMLTVALFMDTGMNHGLLKEVLEGAWSKTQIGINWPSPEIAASTLASPSFHSQGIDRTLVIYTHAYMMKIRSVNLLMRIMQNQFEKNGKLTDYNLKTLDSEVQNALAITLSLQDKLDMHMKENEIKVGKATDIEQLPVNLEKVRSEYSRPLV